jgi:hypothetical protein
LAPIHPLLVTFSGPSKIDENNFMIHFPSADLRDEMTKFKGFEFATAIIKAKMVPAEVEKVVPTWVMATCFPKKAKKFEVIKEIAHLVGDPMEMDDMLLKNEGKIRVKVLCKDATKIKESTLLYMHGPGYLLRWYSEKLQALKGKDLHDFDFDEEDSKDEGEDEGESSGSHDSGFARLGKE